VKHASLLLNANVDSTEKLVEIKTHFIPSELQDLYFGCFAGTQ